MLRFHRQQTQTQGGLPVVTQLQVRICCEAGCRGPMIAGEEEWSDKVVIGSFKATEAFLLQTEISLEICYLVF